MSGFISYSEEALAEKAQALSSRYHFQISTEHFPRLHLSAEGLCLLNKDGQSVRLDWNDKKWKQRSKGGFGADPLIKACMARPGISILDLTAGFGKDALLMAHAGAMVTMLERLPMMAAMLDQGLKGLKDEKVCSRLSLHWIEAKEYLNQMMETPDVIFFDPMHPEREKSALVKKNLQILQQIAPPNIDVVELIEYARTKCQQRLVVKWPAKQPSLIKPQFSLVGKTIRYDVYLAK